MPLFDEIKQNELFDMLTKLGWLQAGSVDATKQKLSAAGLAQFDRFLETLDAKSRVLVQYKVNANAEAFAKDYM